MWIRRFGAVLKWTRKRDRNTHERAQRIANPLDMSHTHWTHLPSRGVRPGQTRNPLLQGGVVTTADDYMKFLTMLAQDGHVRHRRILSTKAIDAMETVQALGKPMAYITPGGAHDAQLGGAQYALGNVFYARSASEGRREFQRGKKGDHRSLHC
jgi:CubicO group peptidase (beta-lactamase class C family)